MPTGSPKLRFVTLNLAHGRRLHAHQALLTPRLLARNLERVASSLRPLGADVVALQEADGPSSWSGNFDHVATLAELTDLETFFRGDHNPFKLGRLRLASGTALLARHPLIAPASVPFASSWRDTKGFVVASVKVPEWRGGEIDVVSVHLDFLRPTHRRRQIDHLAEFLAGRDRPLVLLGDLNCCFASEPRTMNLLSTQLGLRAHEPHGAGATFPSRRPRRRLDWILISPELRFKTYRTMPVPLSDHLGVVADITAA